MLPIFTVQWQRSMNTGAIISTETSSVWVFYCLHSEKELIKIQHDQPNSVLSANAFPSNLYKGKLYIKTGSVVQSLTGISPWISNSIYSLYIIHLLIHGPLTRYIHFRVAHAPGMPGTFSPPPRISDPGMHHGTCVTHVPRCMPGSLTSGFRWSRWRGKRSWHSRRMRKVQIYVSGKRPMALSSPC